MTKLTKKLIRKIEKKLELVGLSVEDLKARWDSSLSVEENLKNLGLDFEVNNDRDYEEYVKRKMIEEEERYYNKRLKEQLRKLKKTDIKELSVFFDKIYKNIDMLVNSKDIHGLIIVGDRGLGKSFNVRKKLNEIKKDFALIKGHITPLIFYKKLYENRDKIILIDDVPNLLKNETILGILLNALDFNERVVMWSSSSPLIDLPERFLFEGKIIIILNRIPEENEFLNALLNRCLRCFINFNDDERLKILHVFAKKKGIDESLIDYMVKLGIDLNLRNLIILNEANKFGCLHIMDDLMINDKFRIARMIKDLELKHGNVKDAVKEFIEKTGYSRRTYFRYKKIVKVFFEGVSPMALNGTKFGTNLLEEDDFNGTKH